MESSSAPAHVDIKVYYDNCPDIRRIRMSSQDLSLENLKQRIAANQQDVRIAYKDSEGDWITLFSDDELHDAVFVYKTIVDPVFRVKVIHGNNTRNNRSQTRPQFPNFNELPRELEQLAGTLTEAFADLQGAARQNPIFSEFINTFNNALNNQRRQQQQQQQQQPAQSQSEPQQQQQQQERRHPCHGGHHHSRDVPPRRFGCHRRRRCPMAGDNMSSAYKAAAVHMMIHKAVRFMNEGDLNSAEAELTKARDLNPNAELVYYNLACIESLRGNLEQSIAHLQSAVDCGYTNIDWMLKDEDLANIRPLRAFHELIARMYTSKNGQPGPSQQQEAAPSSPSEAPASEPQTQEPDTTEEIPMPSPSAPQQEEPAEESAEEPAEEPTEDNEQLQKWQKQLHLLHEMGLLDDEQNITLLERWNGNLARVVNEAFTSN